VSPSDHFRKAHELFYRMSLAQPAEQGILREEFEEAVLGATVIKVTPEKVRASIIEFNDQYTCLRLSGKSPKDAFDLIRPTRAS